MKIGIYFNYLENGPGKVVNNLIKGFNYLDIEHLINQDGDVNLILQDIPRLRGDLSNCILGPNISTLPIDNNQLLDYTKYLKTIVPCEWVKNKYKKWIPENHIEVWPVGIDTSKFIETNNYKKYDFLIYFKRRSLDELNYIKNFLTIRKKSFIIIQYGTYTEIDFINLISECRYGFIIDGCESQGIAIQEMMSCNLPLIVWDMNNWSDRGDEFKVAATSVPYFDDRCGLRFYSIEELEYNYESLINSKYSPRDFILENLSIEKSTKKIIQIINYENTLM